LLFCLPIDPGRVQVFVRIRPPNEVEDLNKHPLAVQVEDEENTQVGNSLR